MNAQERRSVVRWQINRPAGVKLEGAQNYADCQIRDLNFKGMQIALGLRLPRDALLKLCLFLSEDFTLDIEAWVVWHRAIDGHNLYGLYFSKIKDKDKEGLYRFMRRNFPEHMHQQWWRGTEKNETLGPIMHPGLSEGQVSRRCGNGSVFARTAPGPIGGAGVHNGEGGEAMEDRRIFDRFSASFPVKFLNPHSGKEGQAHARDISAKGVGLRLNERLTPATPLELWLEVPDKGEPLYTRGEIVWSRAVRPDEYQAGISLEKADLMGLSRVMRTV